MPNRNATKSMGDGWPESRQSRTSHAAFGSMMRMKRQQETWPRYADALANRSRWALPMAIKRQGGNRPDAGASAVRQRRWPLRSMPKPPGAKPSNRASTNWKPRAGESGAGSDTGPICVGSVRPTASTKATKQADSPRHRRRIIAPNARVNAKMPVQMWPKGGKPKPIGSFCCYCPAP